jgi:hypothetical protein
VGPICIVGAREIAPFVEVVEQLAGKGQADGLTGGDQLGSNFAEGIDLEEPGVLLLDGADLGFGKLAGRRTAVRPIDSGVEAMLEAEMS